MLMIVLQEIESDIWKLVQLVCTQPEIDTVGIKSVIDGTFGKLLFLNCRYLTGIEHKKISDINDILNILIELVVERESLKNEIMNFQSSLKSINKKEFAEYPRFLNFDVASQAAKRLYTKLSIEQKAKLVQWFEVTRDFGNDTISLEQISNETGLSAKVITNWYVLIESMPNKY